MLGLRLFCSFLRPSELLDLDLYVLWNEMGGCVRCRCGGCSAGRGGFKEPGLRISKPDPCPRTTCDPRFSNDGFSGFVDVSLGAVEEQDAILKVKGLTGYRVDMMFEHPRLLALKRGRTIGQ